MNADEFWALVDKRDPAECWSWLGAQNGEPGTPNARGRIWWDGRMQYAYRISWQLANDADIPTGLVARHSCDNPICVNPSHIQPGTHADNSRDMDERGRRVTVTTSGLKHPAATVPPEVIRAAVEEYLNGDERQEDVAARYGVRQSTFSRWVLGQQRTDAGLPRRSRGKLKPCGTRAAYERHRRNGEKPCEDCRVAELEDQRRRADKARRAAA